MNPYTWVMLSGIYLMPGKSQFSLAVVILTTPLLYQCGGQTELVSIQHSSGGSMSASMGGSTGSSGITSTGGTSALIQSDAGLGCQLLASDLDYSCTEDSDCVAVPGGDPCSPNCLATCLSYATVNSRVAAKYLSDFNIPNGGNWQTFACRGCPPCVVGPCC